jgi:hypothetical protein
MSTRNPSIAPYEVWQRAMDLELKWARRWRDNQALAVGFVFPHIRAEWLANCRSRMREQALRWRTARREKRRALGLPEIGGDN